MKAVRLVEPGRALVAAVLDDPTPGPGEVLVRVDAGGICRSDVHYRAGTRSVPHTPVTPGHEVAGTVVEVGPTVQMRTVGDRVVLHYLLSCGVCPRCVAGQEQFCETGAMIGLSADGGYAEAIVVPEVNAFALPDAIPSEIGAIMMCSSATSLHALRRGRFEAGETVAVFGCGGLGVSAIRLATALGAEEVYGIDIDEDRLAGAAESGAIAVAFEDVSSLTGLGGVDVALELVGSPVTMQAAVAALGIGGRAVAVGITSEPFPLDGFNDLVLREAEVIGCSDHLASEVAELIDLVATGVVDLEGVVTDTVPLDASAVNAALDRLEAFGSGVRTVITP